MLITIVASLCHSLAGIPADIPVCHEEIVAQQVMPMQACMMGQPEIADWKEKSIYRGDQWTISRIRCIPGEYQVKDAI